MNQHTPYFELRETLGTPGCAICTLAQKSVQRTIESLAYEYANDYQVQTRLRKARGFCNEHAWQLAALPGVALDVAILSRATLLELSNLLQPGTTGGSARPSLRQWLRPARELDATALADALEPQGPCPICEARAETETLYLRLLLEHFDELEIREALERAGGLCLPHLRLALRQPAPAATLQQLVELQQRVTARLLKELEELIRKYDYRYREEEPGAERDSWLRANAFIAGLKGLW